MKRHVLTCLIAALSLTAPAKADLIPPDVAACQGKTSGARCDNGVCKPSRCTKLDYAHWDRDASSSPPTIEYDCLRCGAVLDAGAVDGGAPAPRESSGCNGNCALDAHRPIAARGVALLLAAVVPLLLRRRRVG